MKNIERGTVKYLILLILSTALFGIVLYPLFDFIIDKLITKTEFIYSVTKHIVEPIIFATIFGITFWVVDKKKNEKK